MADEQLFWSVSGTSSSRYSTSFADEITSMPLQHQKLFMGGNLGRLMGVE